MGADKNWAQSYLIDPLNAPDPSDETGPGTHFRSTFAPRSQMTPSPDPSAASEKTAQAKLRQEFTGDSTATTSTNPFRRRAVSGSSATPPTPPTSASPRREHFSSGHRKEAFGTYGDDDGPSKQSSPGKENGRPRPRRHSSLKERYPGDPSVRPLDIIRKDSKRAHRSPHLRKRAIPGPDMIDRLDVQPYHHEGPYDAALISRNMRPEYSPLAAVKDSNAEALRATPREKIVDSLKKHRPLEGTATVPPGMRDQFGRTYEYEEGTDMMRDLGGDYKRVPGVKYHPDDLKGKGEPSYSIEKALKEHKIHGDEGSGIEMKTRSHTRGRSLGNNDPAAEALMSEDYVGGEASGSGVQRSNTTGKTVGSSLKKRFGSLRKKKSPPAQTAA